MSLLCWLQKIVSTSIWKAARPEGRRSRSRLQRCQLWIERLEARETPATDILIATSTTFGGTFVPSAGGVAFMPSAANATIGAFDIQTFLNLGTSVTIDTASTFPNPGNITEALSATILKSAGGNATLALVADHSINVSQSIGATAGQLPVDLNAATTVTISAGITTNGGAFVSTGTTFDNTGGAIATAGGNISLNQTGVTLGASLTSGNGAIAVTCSGISQPAGVIVNAGTGTIAISAGTGPVSLDGTLTTTNASAAAVTIQSTNFVDLGNVTATSGTLLLTAGSVGQSAATALSVANLSASATGVISLISASNAITGTASLANTGANDVSLTNSGPLTLGTTTVGQNLTLIAGGSITQTGTVTVTGTTSLEVKAGNSDILLASAANDLAGPITFAGTLDNIRDVALRNIDVAAAVPTNLTSLTALRNLTLIFNNAAIALPALTLTSGGNLDVTAGGAITQTGALTVPGTSSFAAGANPITLTTTTNAFTGTVSLSNSGANDVSLTSSGALALAASTIGRNLTVNAGGAITQTGALTVGGTSSFSAGANPITLTAATNAFTGAVSLSNSGANDVSLTNSGALVLGASTIGGNLTVSAGGAITQTGALTVGGASSFSAGANPITLTTAANAFTGAVSLSNSGANDVALTSSGALALAASTIGRNLTVNAGGAITQTGALTVGGTSSFSAGANPITLTAATNAFTGAVSLSNSGANDVSLTSSGALTLGASTIGRNLVVTAGGALAITGAVSAGTGGAINLFSTSIAESGGGLLSTTGTLTTNSSSGTALGGANTVGSFDATNFGSGNVSLTNTAAPLTISAIIQFGGGSITVSNTGAVNITGTIGAGAAAINLTSTGALSESGSGRISTTGTLTTISAGGTALGGFNTIGAWNATNTTSGDVQLANSSEELLTITGISQTGGGNIGVDNNGPITTSGAISTTPNGNIALSSTDAITIGAAITASGAAGTVDLNALSLTESPGGTIAALNLRLRSSGISFFGTFSLAQANSVATLAATVGALTFNNVGALVLDTVLATSGIDATGNVTITAGGNLTVLKPVATGSVSLQGNGAILIDAPVTGSPAVILGGAGVDTITVNTSGASPLKLDGLAGNNQYNIQIADLGSPLTIADSGGGSSSATIDGHPGLAGETWLLTPTTVTRTGSPVVTYSGLANLTINASGGSDTVTVNGTSPVTTVNVGGGGNKLLVSSAAGLLSTVAGALNLRVGGTGNRLEVSEVGASVRDVVFLNASRIVSSLGTFAPISYHADTGGDFAGGVLFQTGQGDNSVDVQSTLANAATTVQGGAGNDFLLVSSDPTGNGNLADILGPLVLDGGAGANALEVSEAAATSGDTVFMTSGLIFSNDIGGFKAISYQATGGTFAAGVSLFTGSDNDTVSLQSTRADTKTFVNTGAGNDFILVSSDPSGGGTLAGIAAPLLLDAGPGANRLMVSEFGSSTADTVFVTNALIYSNNVGGFKVISYQATGGTFGGGVALFTGHADDAVLVQSTRADAGTSVNSGAGNDLVQVSSDPFGNGTLTGLAGRLDIATGTGTNRLIVSDQGGTATTTYSILTNASIERLDGVAPIVYGTDGTFSQVLLATSQGNDAVNVRSTLAAAVVTTVQTGDGDDSITVSTAPDGSGGVLAFLKGALAVNAGGGNNQLVVGDGGSTAAGNVLFTASTITSNVPAPLFAAISYAGSFTGTGLQKTSIGTLLPAGIALYLGQATSLNLVSKPAAAQTFIRMADGPGGNAANIDVFSTSAYSGLTIDLGTGQDALNVNDRSGMGQPFIFPGTIPNTGRYLVVYSGSTSEIDFIGTTFHPLF